MGLVIALDPGKVTGVATFRTPSAEVDSWEQTPWQNAAAYVEESLEKSRERFVKSGSYYPAIEIVYESFTPRPGAYTWQPDALHLIGALEFLASKTGASISHQSPAQAKSFSTNEKLKRVGWYKATKGGHANDALRHLLLFTVKHGLFSVEDLLARPS